MGVSLSPSFCVFYELFALGWWTMNLFRKQISTVGLDIGTSMIKAAKLTKKGDAYSLDGYAIEPLEEGAIQSGEIKNPSSLAQSALERGSALQSRRKERRRRSAELHHTV
jgi:hypothetical protein